jgi:isopentenyl phosphate kinase
MKKLTLIKLGGSVITNKEVPMMVREDVLKRLVKEIALAQKETGSAVIIGHGQGSFGHAPALRYKTMDGFINKESVMGMAITQDTAAQLNRIVVQELINEHIPAVSFLFSNTMITNDRKADHWCFDVLAAYLASGLVPVTGGDVIVDKKQGCTIWSTEQVLSHIAQHFGNEHQYEIQRIIHVTEVDGMLTPKGVLIPKVNRTNEKEITAFLNGTKGFDVTGGMGHKIDESLQLLDKGVESYILSGLKKDNLYNALKGKDWVGTYIGN